VPAAFERSRLVPSDGGFTLTAEVDVYGGELDGLITAEVEFESMGAGEGFEPPGWFGAEVTDDARFANQSLAQAARPPEPSG